MLKERAARRALLIFSGTFLLPIPVFLLLDYWFPFPQEKLQRPSSAVVYDRSGSPLRIFLAADGQWRIPAQLDEISPRLSSALVASEDRWFYWHPGVNPFAVARAAWANLREGHRVSGASTIPMQIARLTEPRTRSLSAKVIEAFRALQLSLHYTKREVLLTYLNVTPYGGNIEGIGAAAFFYFGKTPAQLSLAEIAILTTLPRSPNLYDPIRNPETALQARNRVLRQLVGRGVIDEEEARRAMKRSLPDQRVRPPFRAPHFSRLLVENLPGQPRIQSTLDTRIQTVAEQQVKNHIGELRMRGIGNAAAVVLDNRTREVLSMVGSADFFDEPHQGQVNGATARRSPGSTLKPFLYALAYDKGLVVPESILLDIPTNYSGYIAENYDGIYRGRVRAEEALTLSLNASSVRLLARAGLSDFHRTLLEGGLTTLDRPALEYGLPLVLGAGEARLLDLTNLYATLAVGGLHRNFRFTSGNSDEPIRLFSREAAYWVTRSLSRLKRPDLPEAWSLTMEVPAVAWKTGTSYGHRDAWAIGFSEHLTIGVWVGNFDGRGQKGISGAMDAGPLLFDLFRAIEKGRARISGPLGLEIGNVQVCSESMVIPNPFCPKTTSISYLPGRSHLPVCSQHRRILVDTENGLLLKGDCLSNRPYHAEILSVFPAELVAWWKAGGRSVPLQPALSPACNVVLAENRPEIISPDRSSDYVVRRDSPAAFQKIPLVARTGSSLSRVFWYQDGILLASGDPRNSRFIEPVPGTHRLVLVDESGRSDEVTYTVSSN